MKKKLTRFAWVSLIGVMVFLVLLFVDLMTKTLAHATQVSWGKDSWLVHLSFSWNPGMAFSMFADNRNMMIVITVLTAAMIIGIAVLFFTLFKRNTPARVCLAVIEAGAVGNLIDRLYFGMVRDFIAVKKILFINGYTCNVADIYIVLGAIALVFIILFIGKSAVVPLTKKWREQAKREKEESEDKDAKKKNVK